MALAHELNEEEHTGALSEESRGSPWGEIIRDYDPATETRWRFGKPNYARVNNAFFRYRSKKHAPGSLEQVVSKIVKNWEVESHHISDVNQWKTMDTPSFAVSVNGGPAFNAHLLADAGLYNLILGELSKYSATLNTFESSNVVWSQTFPDGFAWECLSVLSGPPRVTFKWRHFGEFSGEFVDKDGVKHLGNGEMVSVCGLCIAMVTDALQITSLDVYYSPDDLVTPLLKNSTHSKGDVRIIPTDEASKAESAPVQGCMGDTCVVM